MQGSPDMRSQPSSQWSLLHDIVMRFTRDARQAGSSGPEVDLKDYLPPAGDSLRLPALHLLIGIDLEVRWDRGQDVRLEVYLGRFPELGSVRTLSVDLVYQEYRVRHQFGDKPALELYQARFPDQFLRLISLIQDQSSSMPSVRGTLNGWSAPSPSVEIPPIQPAGPAAPPVAPAALPLPPGPAASPAPGTPPTAVTGHGPPLPGDAATQVAADRGCPIPPPPFSTVRVIGRWRSSARERSAPSGKWRGRAAARRPIKIITWPVDRREAQQELKSLELFRRLRHPFLVQIQAYWVYQETACTS